MNIGALRLERMKAAKAERAAIVFYLRANMLTVPAPFRTALLAIADDIERGDHEGAQEADRISSAQSHARGTHSPTWQQRAEQAEAKLKRLVEKAQRQLDWYPGSPDTTAAAELRAELDGLKEKDRG